MSKESNPPTFVGTVLMALGLLVTIVVLGSIESDEPAPPPPKREVLPGLWCWVLGCAVEGQFCTRCGRFWP